MYYDSITVFILLVRIDVKHMLACNMTFMAGG